MSNNQDTSEKISDYYSWYAYVVKEVHSPQEETMKSKKTVTFHDMVQCRGIISRYEYTRDEAHRSWLSEYEMEQMTDRRTKTVERMESGKNSRRESTYRGLECYSVQGQAQLTGLIHYCVDSVLDEQDRQYYLEVQDSDMIALASTQASEESAKKALRRGRSDAREAKRCYRRMQDLEKDHDSSERSYSSISFSDEHRNIVPILKTGNGVPSDIRESPRQTTLDVVG